MGTVDEMPCFIFQNNPMQNFIYFSFLFITFLRVITISSGVQFKAAEDTFLTVASVNVPGERTGSAARIRPICTQMSKNHTITCTNELDLAAFLKAGNQPLRVVGSAHSWSNLLEPRTSGDILLMEKLRGVVNLKLPDSQLLGGEVEVLSGTTFAELHAYLDERGLALAWQGGGITGLTVGGAISVGFHGSQQSKGSASSVIRRIVVRDTSTGAEHVLDETNDAGASALKAARLGLGLCGVVTRVTLPIVPQFYLRRYRLFERQGISWLTRKDESGLEALKRSNDRFHFYLHPASGTAWPMVWTNAEEKQMPGDVGCQTAQDQLKDAAMTEFGLEGLPLIMRWDNCSDKSWKVYTHAVDMEKQQLWNSGWFVHAKDTNGEDEASIATEIMSTFSSIGNGAPPEELWLHVRYVSSDSGNVLLSPCRGFTTGGCLAFELALVAPRMDAALPSRADWERYAQPMEAIMMKHGGRPHWAKWTTSKVDFDYLSSSKLEPELKAFRSICSAFDERGRLRNSHLDELLGYT